MIEIRGLRKSYGDNAVVRGVDLDVRDGEVLFVIGPSGSGKSTLLRCLNLLEKPDAGTIAIDGEEIFPASKQKAHRVRQELGMVFQHFNLWPHMSVAQNVMLAPTRLRDTPKNEARQQALSLLRRVGLETKADARPTTLSGGQKQRVAIARALAMAPRAMLFDEPTSALDPEMVGEVLKVVRDLADSGMTMVVVSHELSFARKVADRIAFFEDGSIAEMNTPVELLDNPRTERAKAFLSKVL